MFEQFVIVFFFSTLVSLLNFIETIALCTHTVKSSVGVGYFIYQIWAIETRGYAIIVLHLFADLIEFFKIFAKKMFLFSFTFSLGHCVSAEFLKNIAKIFASNRFQKLIKFADHHSELNGFERKWMCFYYYYYDWQAYDDFNILKHVFSHNSAPCIKTNNSTTTTTTTNAWRCDGPRLCIHIVKVNVDLFDCLFCNCCFSFGIHSASVRCQVYTVCTNCIQNSYNVFVSLVVCMNCILLVCSPSSHIAFFSLRVVYLFHIWLKSIWIQNKTNSHIYLYRM